MSSMVRPVHAPAIAIASALALAPCGEPEIVVSWEATEEARTKRGGMCSVCRLDWHPRRQVETHHP